MRNYRIIPPSPVLVNYVRHFWTLDVHLSSGETFTMKSYVDDSCGIAFQVGEGESIIWNDEQIPPGIVYGLTTAYHSLRSAKSFSIFGAVFHSHALHSIFGFHAANFTDHVTDVRDALDTYLTEQINEAPDTITRIEIIESFLIKKLLTRKKNSERISTLCEYILSNKGMLTMQKLEHRFHIHPRQLERKFQQQIGVSPVHFLKIARFQEALKLLQGDKYPKLTEIAYELEFADQSHFIKQIRRFSGHTPKELKRHYVKPVINLIIPDMG